MKTLTIYKYELQMTDVQVVSMPADAEILLVAFQGGKLCLWAMVNEMYMSVPRCIEMIGTGVPITKRPGVRRAYLETVSVGPVVWHVFEQVED